MPEREQSTGYIYAGVGALAFALMAFSVHLTAGAMPMGELLFIRGCINFIVLVPVCFAELPKLKSWTSRWIWARSIAGASAVLCFFWTLQNGTTGLAMAFLQLSPVFVALYAWILWKERPTARQIQMLAVIAVGSLLYDVGDPISGSTFTFIVGSLGAVLGASAYLSLKSATRDFSPSLIVVAFSLACIVAGLLVPHETWVYPNLNLLPAVAVVCLFGMAGQILTTKAYAYADASIVSVIGLSEIAIGILLETLFHPQHQPTWLALVGSGFVIAGTLGLQVRNRKPRSR